MDFTGTSGGDLEVGTSGDDDFDMSQGGNDVCRGLGGNDLFEFGGALTADDRIAGGSGAGTDTLLLHGDYSAGVIFNDTTMTGIENLDLTGAFSYRLTLADGNVAAHKTLFVDASAASGGTLHFDASAETDGRFIATGTDGNDVIVTGAGNDHVYGGDGDDRLNAGHGTDIVDGGNGTDIIVFTGTGALDASDRLYGGNDAAADTLQLDGNYTSGLVLGGHMLTDIGKIEFHAGHDYSIDATHLDFATAGTSWFDASALGASDTFTFTAAGSTAPVGIEVEGGAGDDSIVGERGYDTLFGFGGADRLDGGGGTDDFDYRAVSESTGKAFDTIVHFDAHNDLFDTRFGNINEVPAGIDPAVKGGTLRASHFNSDLASAIGADQLGVDSAVLFRPTHGDFAGQWFLIVDGNSVGGYQANADLVVHFETPSHMSDFGIGNFGTAG